MPVQIVTDSTADLPPALAAEFGITVVPLMVVFGEEELRDGVDIDGNTFYRRLTTTSVLPKTSQPSVAAFRETYLKLAETSKSNEILSVHVSSKLSGTLNSATLAVAEVAKDGVTVELVDAQTTSLGLGAIALEAAEAVRGGASLAEAAAVARSATERTNVYCLLDTLEFLRRGGRIGRASSMLGSLLNIKPMITVTNGEVAPYDRLRTRARGVERLFEIATKSEVPFKRIMVGGAGDATDAETLLARLRPALPETELVLGQIGPVVGVHTGPACLGIATLERG
jgi:DegV family protein with EDD domain